LRILVTSPYTLPKVCYGALLRSRHERPADGADPSTPPESILIIMRTVNGIKGKTDTIYTKIPSRA